MRLFRFLYDLLDDLWQDTVYLTTRDLPETPTMLIPTRADYIDVRACADYSVLEAEATYGDAGGYQATYTDVTTHAEYSE